MLTQYIESIHKSQEQNLQNDRSEGITLTREEAVALGWFFRGYETAVTNLSSLNFTIQRINQRDGKKMGQVAVPTLQEYLNLKATTDDVARRFFDEIERITAGIIPKVVHAGGKESGAPV